MKFLLITLGSIGDLLPFLAMADALRRRGHRVVLASSAAYAQLATANGFEFAIISDRPAQALDRLIGEDPQAAWRQVREQAFLPAVTPTRNFIADHLKQGPCKVIAAWNAFGAALAHRQYGMPLCTTYLSPHALGEPVEAESGRKIGLYPPWFASDHAPADVQLTGFPMLDDAAVPALPPELEAFLSQGDAPVIFTPGSFMRRTEDFFRQSLAVCQDLGLRGIFLTPYSDQVPAGLPATVRHFPYIALQRLAKHGAALVHHGGIGTCAQALRAGIPQLITPVFFDQPDNAAHVEALGVGRRLQTYARDDVSAMLRQMLSSQDVGAKCQAVRDRFKGQNPVAQICDFAEAMR